MVTWFNDLKLRMTQNPLPLHRSRIDCAIQKYAAEKKIKNVAWYEICFEFISWKSGASIEEIKQELKHVPAVESDTQFNHKTSCNINLSLRYNILKRDDFRCVKCGASPAINFGTQLHIDHKLPWSIGGEIEEDNLQTLCSECNLGKSNKI